MNEFTLVADPKVGLMITMTGQLVLLQLIEQLMKYDIKVILSNTDSVVVELDDSQVNDYYKIIKEWEHTNNYELEETIYEKYFARDVNCYLGLDIHKDKFGNDKIKAKNDFSDEINFNKGMNALIISKVVKDHLLFGKPIEETIRECKDINMFVITYKPDSKFAMEYTTMIDNQPKTKIIQRINRWYISKTFGKLFSSGIDKNGAYKKIDTSANYYLKVINDIKDCDFSCFEEDINYSYYISNAVDFLNKIEYKQTNLF